MYLQNRKVVPSVLARNNYKYTLLVYSFPTLLKSKQVVHCACSEECAFTATTKTKGLVQALSDRK